MTTPHHDSKWTGLKVIPSLLGGGTHETAEEKTARKCAAAHQLAAESPTQTKPCLRPQLFPATLFEPPPLELSLLSSSSPLPSRPTSTHPRPQPSRAHQKEVKANARIIEHVDTHLKTDRVMRQLADRYRQDCILGEGRFSQVHGGVHLETGELVALKSFNLHKLHEEEDTFVMIEHEVHALRAAEKDSALRGVVMHLHEVCRTSLELYLVGDLCARLLPPHPTHLFPTNQVVDCI